MARGSLRKARQARNNIASGADLALPIDKESLTARKLARTKLDLDGISLSINVVAGGKTLRRNYGEYALERHLLIRQLLAGAALVNAGRTTSFTSLQDTYYGIDEFLEFSGTHRYTTGKVRCLADIGIQTARDFEAWYLSVHPGRTVNRKRFGKIRSIVSALKKVHGKLPDIGMDFKWPTGPKNNERPVESYRAETFNDLVNAALLDIRYVMGEWKSYEKKWNSIPVISFPEHTIPDVCLILGLMERSYAERGVFTKSLSIRKTRISTNVMAQRVADRYSMTIGQFVEIYLSSGEELSRSGVVFPTYKVDRDKCFSGYSLEESWDIATKTTADLYHEWPLGMDVVDASYLVSNQKFRHTLEGINRIEASNYRVLQSMRYGTAENVFEIGIDAFFARTFFTGTTLYPFYLYVQLNTGWNEEVVGSISRNLDNHVQSDIIDPDYVLIWGWKGKVNSPISHRSSRTAPYSVYNILRFVSEVLERQPDPDHQLSDGLWQYVLSKNLWTKFDRAVSELGSGTSITLSAGFLRRHSIDIGTTFKKYQRVDSRRLRTTCETRRRESGLSIDEVCTLMGHAQIDTTDAHYDSDSASIELKNRRLRGLQEEFVADFRDYRARLVDSATLQELRAAIEWAGGTRGARRPKRDKAETGLTEREVVHLLSPKGQTYIAACVDRTGPTWPNAEQFILPGGSCSFFNRCCLCDKAVIFEEALPFIARRVMDLERLRQKLATADWVENYGQEAHAWQAILEDWNDQGAVQRAHRQSLKSEFALPLAMKGI